MYIHGNHTPSSSVVFSTESSPLSTCEFWPLPPYLNSTIVVPLEDQLAEPSVGYCLLVEGWLWSTSHDFHVSKICGYMLSSAQFMTVPLWVFVWLFYWFTVEGLIQYELLSLVGSEISVLILANKAHKTSLQLQKKIKLFSPLLKKKSKVIAHIRTQQKECRCLYLQLTRRRVRG